MRTSFIFILAGWIYIPSLTSSATALPNNLPVLDSRTPLALRPRSALRSTPLLIPPSTRLLLEIALSFLPSSRGVHTDIIFIGTFSTLRALLLLLQFFSVFVFTFHHYYLYFIFRFIHHHHHRLLHLFFFFIIIFFVFVFSVSSLLLLCVSVLLLTVSKGKLTAKSRTLASQGI